MRITVRYTAQVREAAGTPSEEIELPSAATVRELVKSVAARHDERFRNIVLGADGEAHGSILLVAGGEQVRADRALRDGETVTIMAPISGG